ncbi:hypothetical protein HDU77_008113 [Chytriomyces hyalinus]|nr:hypothetical protein HDU77_008113 [Chytriomyces hyalinus]
MLAPSSSSANLLEMSTLLPSSPSVRSNSTTVTQLGAFQYRTVLPCSSTGAKNYTLTGSAVVCNVKLDGTFSCAQTREQSFAVSVVISSTCDISVAIENNIVSATIRSGASSILMVNQKWTLNMQSPLLSTAGFWIKVQTASINDGSAEIPLDAACLNSFKSAALSKPGNASFEFVAGVLDGYAARYSSLPAGFKFTCDAYNSNAPLKFVFSTKERRTYAFNFGLRFDANSLRRDGEDGGNMPTQGSVSATAALDAVLSESASVRFVVGLVALVAALAVSV